MSKYEIPEAAVEAAANQLWPGGTKEQHRLRNVRAALEAAAPHIRAQALEEMAASVLTNDPLDFWDMHLPEGLGFQEAVSRWLKAYARAEMSQTPDDFATRRSQA